MPKVEHMRDGHAPAFTDTFAIGQERRDAAAWIRRHVADRALRDHMPAFGTGDRTHFDEMIAYLEHTHIMVDDHHGVAIRHEVAHHAE